MCPGGSSLPRFCGSLASLRWNNIRWQALFSFDRPPLLSQVGTKGGKKILLIIIPLQAISAKCSTAQKKKLALKTGTFQDTLTATKHCKSFWIIFFTAFGVFSPTNSIDGKNYQRYDDSAFSIFDNKSADQKQFNMTQLLLLGKVEYGWGPIFKVVLEC